MLTIYKYTLSTTLTMFPLPHDHTIVLVGEQGEATRIWIKLDTTAPTFPYRFIITDTGHPVQPDWTHVGSYQSPPFVWHVWRLPLALPE